MFRLSNEFFCKSSIERIKNVLRQVIEPLREWQGHQFPLEGTLFDAYLNRSQDALQCLATHDDTILLPDSDIRLPSPICWALRHREPVGFLAHVPPLHTAHC